MKKSWSLEHYPCGTLGVNRPLVRAHIGNGSDVIQRQAATILWCSALPCFEIMKTHIGSSPVEDLRTEGESPLLQRIYEYERTEVLYRIKESAIIADYGIRI